MAGKKPQVGADVQLGDDFAFAVFPAVVIDFQNAVEHQHIGQRQLRIAGAEHFGTRAGQQIFLAVLILAGGSGHILSPCLLSFVGFSATCRPRHASGSIRARGSRFLRSSGQVLCSAILTESGLSRHAGPLETLRQIHADLCSPGRL